MDIEQQLMSTANYGEQGYLNLVKNIIEHGAFKEPARINMPRTKSLFGNMLKFNLKHTFPLFTTKSMFTKGMIGELLWFMSGCTNVKTLHKQGITKFWHQDAYNFYVKQTTKQCNSASILTFEQWQDALNNDAASIGDCGHIYGHQWRKFNGEFDQLLHVIQDIVSNPYGRYKVITAWNPCDMTQQALPACHMIVQFNCRPMQQSDRLHYLYEYDVTQYELLKDTPNCDNSLDKLNVPKYILDCSMTQRSADMMLGVPINIASYSLLTCIVAKLTNCMPGMFTWFGNDCHIYEHHIETAKQQLIRQPFKEPTLNIDTTNWLTTDAISITSSDKLTNLINSMSISDFTFANYKCHDKLQFELFTGMK